MALLEGNVLVENWHSVTLYVIDVKVFLSIVGVDWIQLEEVLFAVGGLKLRDVSEY